MIMRKGKIYCPANGWDCPYYKNGECGIENALLDCSDFRLFGTKEMISSAKMKNELLLNKILLFPY